MAHVYVTEREIHNAVEAVLDTYDFPIYKREDDRGLEDEEYYAFVCAVVRKLGMIVPKKSL